MAIEERTTTRDLVDQLLSNAHNYSFYRLLEHLYDLHEEEIEDLSTSSSMPERVILEGDARIAFPASDVISAERIQNNDVFAPTSSKNDLYRVKTAFLSLQGPDSPLPGYFIDQLAYDYVHNIGIRPAFFDFFNHRLLSLLSLAWRKYRYYKRFQHSARDQFSKYIFSLVGLNDENLRGSTPLPWSRLLSFAGIIASRSRSPSVVSGIIAHCFDLSDVEIREYEQRYVDVAPEERNQLGRQNTQAGLNFVLGARVSTMASKFTIVISELTYERFKDFLPNGGSYEPMRKLIDFLLRDSLAYDLELGLKQEEIPPLIIKKDNFIFLGWNTFLPQDAPLRLESTVNIKARR